MPYGYTQARPPVPRVTAPRSPNNRGGMLGASPSFPTLASALSPNDRGGPLGAGGGAPVHMPAPQAARPPAAPAAAAPSAPAAQQPVTNPQSPVVAYDYSADPVLNQIQAIGAQDRTSANANALRLKKQLAIDYGDVDLANQLGDTNTAQAAGQNPFSVTKQLEQSYQRGQTGLEDQYNKANLFYSGARVKGLGDLANQYQGQVAGALGQEQSALGGIGDQLTKALSSADASDAAAQQAAADRALQLALANGIDPGAAAPGAAAGAGPAAVPSPVAAASPAATPEAASGLGLTQPDQLAIALGQAANTTGIQRANTGYEGPLGGPRQAAPEFYPDAAQPSPAAPPQAAAPTPFAAPATGPMVPDAITLALLRRLAREQSYGL